MTAILYSPEFDQIYEWDGWFLTYRDYCDVGGLTDETGATYFTGTLAAYGSYKDFGLIRIDTLE